MLEASTGTSQPSTESKREVEMSLDMLFIGRLVAWTPLVVLYLLSAGFGIKVLLRKPLPFTAPVAAVAGAGICAAAVIGMPFLLLLIGRSFGTLGTIVFNLGLMGLLWLIRAAQTKGRPSSDGDELLFGALIVYASIVMWCWHHGGLPPLPLPSLPW